VYGGSLASTNLAIDPLISDSFRLTKANIT
jgi:hypothetical protein